MGGVPGVLSLESSVQDGRLQTQSLSERSRSLVRMEDDVAIFVSSSQDLIVGYRRIGTSKPTTMVVE